MASQGTYATVGESPRAVRERRPCRLRGSRLRSGDALDAQGMHAANTLGSSPVQTQPAFVSGCATHRNAREFVALDVGRSPTLSATHHGFAQPPGEEPDPLARSAPYLELPTLAVSSRDTSGYPVPSARNSLWLTLASCQVVKHYLGHWTGFDRKTGASAISPGAAIVCSNAFMWILPPGMEYQHEQ